MQHRRSKAYLVEKLRGKFEDEAKSIFKMKHNNIVHVLDIFEENGTSYYVMDYIDGPSLSDIVKKNGALPEAKALKYMLQVCDALKYVHSLNRLHLDIKPGNIMINENDDAILIDFGASKHYSAETGENTTTMQGLNTPGYAPIEQTVDGITTFTPASDIYAVGATLYKLLTGKTPISSSLRASGEELEPLYSHISENVREAVMKAMAINKKNRPQSIDEFVGLLNRETKSAQSTTEEHKKTNSRINDDEATVFETTTDTPKKVDDSYKVETPYTVSKQSNYSSNSSSSQKQQQSARVTVTEIKEEKDNSGLLKAIGLIALIVIIIFIFIRLSSSSSPSAATSTNSNQQNLTSQTNVANTQIDSTFQNIQDQKPIKVTDYEYSYEDSSVAYYWTGQIDDKGNPLGIGTVKYPKDNALKEYYGDFTNHFWNGTGTLKFRNGDSYVGSFNNGCFVQGTWTQKENGLYYEGTFDAEGKTLNGIWYNLKDRKAVYKVTNGTIKEVAQNRNTSNNQVSSSSNQSTASGNQQSNASKSKKNYSFSISTNPTNASVYLDGKLMGTSPVNAVTSSGNHTIKVIKNGYETYEKSMYIGNNRSITIKLTLKYEPYKSSRYYSY